jgi:hypothetical protein
VRRGAGLEETAARATRRRICSRPAAPVFALDNVDPIRDGALYRCEFEITAAGDGCCAVRFDRLGSSDPVGNALTT